MRLKQVAMEAIPLFSPDYKGAADEHPDLVGEYAHAYRRLVARANHISIDRPDIAFPIKKLCKKQ